MFCWLGSWETEAVTEYAAEMGVHWKIEAAIVASA